VKTDGSKGWITVKGNQGTLFLESIDGGEDYGKLLDSQFIERQEAKLVSQRKLNAAIAAVEAAEAGAESLPAVDETLTARTLKESEAPGVASEAKKTVTDVRTKARTAAALVAELVPFATQGSVSAAEVDGLKDRVDKADERTSATSELCKTAVSRAKEFEQERLKSMESFLQLVRDQAKAFKKPKTISDFLDGLATNGRFDRSFITEFCSKHNLDLEADQQQYIFEFCDVHAEGKIAAVTLSAMAGTIYTCNNSIALTDTREIGQGKIIHKLEKGDAVEEVEPPVEDEGTKVIRVHVRVGNNNKISGWTSVRGNQGTIFLEKLPLPRVRENIQSLDLGVSKA